MRRVLVLIWLLFAVLHVKAQDEMRILSATDNVEAAWEKLWKASGPLARLQATEYGELFIPAQEPNKYMKARKQHLKLFDKSIKKIQPEDYEAVVEHFREKLYTTISSEAPDHKILSDANLYLKLLPEKEVQQRVNIYRNIILPIYYDRGELREIHYIASMLQYEQEQKYAPDDEVLALSKEAMAQYEELKTKRSTSGDDLTGMWVSMNEGKLPKYLLGIHDADSTLLAVLQPYDKRDYTDPRKFISMVRYDSLERIKLFFTNTEFRQGMSEAAVAGAGNMVSGISEGMVKGLAKNPNISAGGMEGVQLGANLFSGLMMLALSSSSANTNTNTYIDMTLTPTDDHNRMKVETKSKIEAYQSNKAVPKITNERLNVNFQRIAPDEDLLFMKGRKGMVVGYPARQAYMDKEYYKFFKTYRKHLASHRTIKNAPWYILYTYAMIPYLTSDHGRYNKKIYQQMKQKYVENE